MSNDLLTLAFFAWLAAALISLSGRGSMLARALLFAGCAAGVLAALVSLPNGTPIVTLPTRLAGAAVSFQVTPTASGCSVSDWCRRRSPARWRAPHVRAAPVGCSAPP